MFGGLRPCFSDQLATAADVVVVSELTVPVMVWSSEVLLPSVEVAF